MAGKLFIIFELHPVGEASRLAAVPPMHQPQQRLTVELPQYCGTEAITEQRDLLIKLCGRLKFTGRQTLAKRSLQLVNNVRLKDWCAH
jgi:hypothetical protein